MANNQRRFFGSLYPIVMFVVALSLTLMLGCGDDYNTPSGPEEVQEILLLSPDNPQVRAVMAVQDRHTEDIMSRPGVVGVATGLDEDGNPAIIVMMESLSLSKKAFLPDEFESVPVVTRITGEIKALKGKPPQNNDKVDHTAQFRPAPLGVSTGHPDITACTVGARLKDVVGNLFVLSNNHCYADVNAAKIGDAVIQPGTFDGGSSPADDIGNLADFQIIDFSPGGTNEIDAAIASTTDLLVGNTTTSDCYGTPKSTTIAAAVNMKVKKCGRTTGLTKGSIIAINATVNVNYGAPGVATFVNQIVTTNISAGGDSGSLVVVDGKGKSKNDDRKPVGLLYAGSSSITILNPIDLVLNHFGMTIDGE